MLYLFNNQTGYDRHALGFPSVTGCNAIVYQTTQGLYGMHSFGGTQAMQRKGRAVAFREYVQTMNIPHQTNARHLYSVINQTFRYHAESHYEQQWEEEMRQIAEQLQYRGRIQLVRLSRHLGGVNDNSNQQGAYIEFRVRETLGGCSIKYKRWPKMSSTRLPGALAPAPLGELKAGNLVVVDIEQMVPYSQRQPNEYINTVNLANAKSDLHNAFLWGNASTRTISAE